MMMLFTSFTLPPLVIFIILSLFFLVLVDNEAFPDSTLLLLVFFRLFRAICGNGVIGSVFLCIQGHIIFSLSFPIFEGRRRRGHDGTVRLRLDEREVCRHNGTQSHAERLVSILPYSHFSLSLTRASEHQCG